MNWRGVGQKKVTWQKNDSNEKSRSMGMRGCKAPRDWSFFVDSLLGFEPAKNVWEI